MSSTLKQNLSENQIMSASTEPKGSKWNAIPCGLYTCFQILLVDCQRTLDDDVINGHLHDDDIDDDIDDDDIGIGY